VAYDFTGKVAVGTGSAGGIGQAYAEAPALSGAAVVVADIDEAGAKKVAEGIRFSGGSAQACRVDVWDANDANVGGSQVMRP
jgi:3-oxoacyl-[acyl-carrier protein] reductase